VTHGVRPLVNPVARIVKQLRLCGHQLGPCLGLLSCRSNMANREGGCLNFCIQQQNIGKGPNPGSTTEYIADTPRICTLQWVKLLRCPAVSHLLPFSTNIYNMAMLAGDKKANASLTNSGAGSDLASHLPSTVVHL
jgi:hypothetical protein